MAARPRAPAWPSQRASARLECAQNEMALPCRRLHATVQLAELVAEPSSVRTGARAAARRRPDTVVGPPLVLGQKARPQCEVRARGALADPGRMRNRAAPGRARQGRRPARTGQRFAARSARTWSRRQSPQPRPAPGLFARALPERARARRVARDTAQRTPRTHARTNAP